MSKGWSNTLTVDIETVPPLDWSEERRRAWAAIRTPKTHKNPETRAKWVEENTQSEWEKLGLSWEHLRIVAIGYAFGTDPVQVLTSDDEASVIQGFERALTEAGVGEWNWAWIGHNIAGFDGPHLYRRALKHGARHLARCIPSDRWGKGFQDTMTMWAASARDRFYKLDDVARYLGLGEKTGSGSDVWKLVEADRWRDLSRYCAVDVSLTRKLYAVLAGLPVPEED